MDDAVLTVAETGAYLKTDEKLVLALINERRIPHVRLGHRKVVVPRHALDEWLRSEAFQNLADGSVVGLVADSAV